jgi:hypothetical protein
MVKCIRLQLIGFITKSSRIDYRDVLKYVNNPENPGGALQKALKPMKALSIDSNPVSSSSNSKKSSDNVNTSSSKYDNISILVDYDVILWGKFKTSKSNINNSNDESSSKNNTSFMGGLKSANKSLKDDNFGSRKDLINHKFAASRLGNEPMKLPFSFKLCHITDNSSFSLPSSYKNGKCQIEYFLYATIYRPWPNRNSIRVMNLRVLQKIKIDLPIYNSPQEQTKVKELKFMKYIKKGIIEMNVKIPQKAFCHRDNIPIEIKINHLGMNKSIIGFCVGLYEICSYEDTNNKKFVKYSFKLLSERFYEYQIEPGESNVFTVLNFPIIDGNCSIQKKFIKSDIFSSNSSSLSGSEENMKKRKESIKNNDDSIMEDDELSEEEKEEKDITRILLKDAKIPYISATINDPSRWPIKVEHKLRVVAITNEYIKKIINKIKGDDKNGNDENEKENENEPANNDYEEYVETDSQANIKISPPASPNPDLSNSSLAIQSNGYLNSDQQNESRRMSFMGSNSNNTTKDLLNIQNAENQKFINENKKYGVILGHLSNGDTPTLSKSKKALDIEFDIVIGTMTRVARLYGKEFKLQEEIEDQYYNAIIRKNNINNKLKLVNTTISSGSMSNKIAQKKEDTHTRARTNSSNNSLSVAAANNLNEENITHAKLSPILSAASINKDLPLPPTKNTKDETKKVSVLPQQPPELPPRNNTDMASSSSTPLYPAVQSDYQYQASQSVYQYPVSQPGYQYQIPQPGYQYQTSQSGYQYQAIQPEYQYFPNMQQYSNPEEFIPSAPTFEDINTPPPPYEYDSNTQPQSQTDSKSKS